MDRQVKSRRVEKLGNRIGIGIGMVLLTVWLVFSWDLGGLKSRNVWELNMQSATEKWCALCYLCLVELKLY